MVKVIWDWLMGPVTPIDLSRGLGWIIMGGVIIGISLSLLGLAFMHLGV